MRRKGRSLSCHGRIRIVSAVIENISVIGFVDFAIGIANQNIILTHVGPVCAGIGRGKVTQLVLFDGVLRRLILRGRGVADFKLRKIGNKLLLFIGLDAGRRCRCLRCSVRGPASDSNTPRSNNLRLAIFLQSYRY